MKIPYKLRSIKLIIAFVVMVLGTVFFLLGIGDATYDGWVRFIMWIVNVFMVANVASKHFNKDKDKHNERRE